MDMNRTMPVFVVIKETTAEDNVDTSLQDPLAEYKGMQCHDGSQYPVKTEPQDEVAEVNVTDELHSDVKMEEVDCKDRKEENSDNEDASTCYSTYVNPINEVCDLVMKVHEENVTAAGVSRGRPSAQMMQLTRLEVKHSRHWPGKGSQRRCRVCSLDKKTKYTVYYCKKCDVGLCVIDCFEKWHTRV